MGGGLNTGFFTPRITSCETLIIKTQLYSPNAEILKTLKVNDNLKVILMSDSGPCVAMKDNEIVGTIISKEMLQLMQCLVEGFHYEARVRRLSGGECAITIKPAI